MTEQKPIGIGIVGLGRAGWGMHCRELAGRQDKFRFVAAMDKDRTRVARMVERYGCRGYRTLEELFADPEVELVDIASRSPNHEEQGIKALQAGKYVFLEKPMALTHAGANHLARAAARSKGALFVRHNRRFEPAFNHIREILADGLLGNVYEIKLRRLGYARRDDWQTLIRCGGGQLLNWGPHIIDHALVFLDSPIVSFWSDLKKIAAVGDAEDHLKIVMKGKNGRVVDLEISGGAALSEPEYIIFGTRGALTCDGRTIHLRYLDPEHPLPARRATSATPPNEGSFGSPDDLKWIDREEKVAPKSGDQMDNIWDHLYATIREGRPFPVTMEQSAAVMAVITRAKKGTRFAG